MFHVSRKRRRHQSQLLYVQRQQLMTASSMHMGVVDVCAITSRDPDDCGWNGGGHKSCTLPRSNSQRSNYSYSPVATRTTSTLNHHHYHPRPQQLQDGGSGLSEFHRPSLPSGHVRAVLTTANNHNSPLHHVTGDNCNPMSATIIDSVNGAILSEDSEFVQRPAPPFDRLSPSHAQFTNCCSPGGIHNFHPTIRSPTHMGGGSPWKQHALTPVHHHAGGGGGIQHVGQHDPRDLHPQCTCSMRRTTPQFSRRRDDGRQDASTRLYGDAPPPPPPPPVISFSTFKPGTDNEYDSPALMQC